MKKPLAALAAMIFVIAGDICTAADAASKPVAQPDAVTHVAIVVDTSGSMRDAKTDQLFTGVVQAIDDTLSLFPDAKFIQVVDADGRVISKPSWTPNLPAGRSVLQWDVANYPVYSVSNPVPGLRTVLSSLSAEPTAKAFVLVIGDKLIADAMAAVSMPAAIAQLNPAGTDGKPRARISAIQVPTGESPETRANFESIMKRVTAENGGAFVLLEPAALRSTPVAASISTWSGLTIFKGPITSAPPEPTPAASGK